MPLSAPACLAASVTDDASVVSAALRDDAGWRGEVSQRVEAYRARRRKPSIDASQSRFVFEPASTSFVADAFPSAPTRANSIAVAEPSPSTPSDDFSFSIAIGRNAATRDTTPSRIEIDVSIPPQAQAVAPASATQSATTAETSGLYPVASLEARRSAAFIDFACLLFAYGGFLALFGSLGGQFTLSKLSAAVYAVSFSIVYLQYFALFTIFGGTTPGMIFRGLQVASFTGDAPTPRQMLLRSLGYILSAGTFFLGFFWAWWDEDALTWHDRLSRTYLSPQQPDFELEPSAAPSHPR